MTGLVGFEYFKVKHNFINYLLQYFVSKNMPKRNSFQDSTREILISEVQTRPCLWNDEHPQYKDSEKNKKIWEEIGKVIEMTGIAIYYVIIM